MGTGQAKAGPAAGARGRSRGMVIRVPKGALSLWARYWSPPLLWCAGILLLSGDLGSSRKTLSLFYWVISWFPHLSPAEVEAWHAWWRKLGHILAYGILYLLFFRALGLHLPRRPWSSCLLALILTTGVAGADEVRQSLVPTRSGTVADVGLDLFGALLAAGLIPGLWRRQRPGPGRCGRLPE